jgi:hypothetical protein
MKKCFVLAVVLTAALSVSGCCGFAYRCGGYGGGWHHGR